ncbi:MAG: hypothetical protein HP494_06815 [Nitrospira sp.]|nr:hypothetical protein [Nitrospira sp.]
MQIAAGALAVAVLLNGTLELLGMKVSPLFMQNIASSEKELVQNGVSRDGLLVIEVVSRVPRAPNRMKLLNKEYD